nr:MAG TPA: DNA methylase [Caudoviricetes sp.]
MRRLPADHFDAVITDPPYGIIFAGEKWDTATPQGFQAWAQSWGEEALRVIKPGGYLLAFSAPRTYHRLTSALEDAGFEIRDAMAWIRADGKPAGMDLSSAFDRATGVLDQREGRDVREWADEATATHMSSHKLHATGEPVTDEAKTWEGWGVGLKPAWEPIVVARRPLEGRLVDNVREHGTGAMNIRAGMDAAGGSYPPNLLMGEQAMAAAVQQGAPDHVWPVFRYQPKAPKRERPIVGGGTARHREAPRAHAIPDPSRGAARCADPRTVRRVGHNPAGGGHGERARGRLRTRRQVHPAHQSTFRAGHRSAPQPVRHGR